MPLVTVLSASVALSVAVSKPVPINVVDASVIVLGVSLEDVGGAASDVCVPVMTTIPSSDVDDDEEELDVVVSASSFACAKVPRLRSTSPQSLKGAIEI